MSQLLQLFQFEHTKKFHLETSIDRYQKEPQHESPRKFLIAHLTSLVNRTMVAVGYLKGAFLLFTLLQFIAMNCFYNFLHLDQNKKTTYSKHHPTEVRLKYF